MRSGLDHIYGEVVEGLDEIFQVAPLNKWTEQTRLTTVVKEVRGNKFKQEVDVEKPIWLAALEYAQRAFYNSGATPGLMSYDCIVQEYPRTGQICFIFNADIGGEEMFVTAPFQLSDQQIADLTTRGLWQPYRMH